MSQPRQVLPGTTYLLTRRCVQRQFLLKPTSQLLEVFAFCLAVASNRTGVTLHAFTVMSNHWHAVLTDVEGRLPEFAEWLHKYVAKCMNCSLDRTENFWSSDHYNAIPLIDTNDVLDKIVYTMANPVSAGLVPRARDWPGLRSEPASHLENPVAIDRPRIYFREHGEVPERAVLKVEKPPAFVGIQDEEYAQILEVELGRREAEQRRRVARAGRGFLGVRRVRSKSPFQRATTAEPLFRPTPKIAARKSSRRIAAIQKLKSFLIKYKKALEKFKNGVVDVLFPAGTYWMRRFLGVACEEPVDMVSAISEWSGIPT